MEVRKTLLPGQHGTKDLIERYGEQLVCVRYRYDKLRRKRYKTVELIVNETDWIPEEVISAEKWVLLRIGYGEGDLREKVKAAGGYWEPESKAWRLRYGKALDLKLAKRIVEPPNP